MISPDGSRLVFSARDADGQVMLYLRPLEAAQAHVLAGTEEAQYPFWSPDGRWIGFFTQEDGTLKKIGAAGGPPLTLCPAPDGKGGSWGTDEVIVFAPSSETPIHRVSAAGGESTAVTELDGERFDSHRHPRFLPDGRRFLFVARSPAAQNSTLMLGSLDAEAAPRELMQLPTQAELASGRLLFVRERTLMAQPFDVDGGALTGEAVAVAEGIVEDYGAAISIFSASQTGVLTYQLGEASSGVGLQWVDRRGFEIGDLGEAAAYRTASVSPDGRYAVASVGDWESGSHDLWLFEIERNVGSRFTFEPADEWLAAWTPDSEEIIYTSASEGQTRFFRKAVSGAGEPVSILEVGGWAQASSVSPDGRFLAFAQVSESTEADLRILPLEDGGEARVFRQTKFMEVDPRFSPDGRWLAYFSDESGGWEVYVEPFPGPGKRLRVSTDTGVYPFWRSDGRELFYQQYDGRVMAVAVEPRDKDLRLGRPEPLFRTGTPTPGGALFAPSPDGETFLVVPTEEQEADTLLTLAVNWPGILPE